MARVLRPVDLARVAGVSTQQIRNYVDEGVLPETERSAAGYRQFGNRHVDALLTYRAMAKGFGWETARAVMRAINTGALAEAYAMIDAGHATLHQDRLAVEATIEALDAVADAPAPAQDDLRIGEVAAYLRVRPSALRVWETAGLLTPGRNRAGYRSYNRTDIRDVQMIAVLRRQRYPLPAIKELLDEIRRTGGRHSLRTAIADRRAALTQRSADMLTGAMHLHGYLAHTQQRP
jgi:DNA-binding transcriptional MerR regulator